MSNRFRIASQLPVRLQEAGLALPLVLGRAGLPSGFFAAEKMYASTNELFALWQAIGELSPDPAIGLRFGSEPRLERYHPTAIAALCSRTFGDAVERMARYKQLTCPEEIRLHREGETAVVEFFYLEAQAAEPDVLVDVCLAWITSIARRGTDGQVTPLRVELRRPLQQRELLEQHYGCRVKFKAARNALVFAAGDLDQPFSTFNQELLTVLGGQLESELQAQRQEAGVIELVRKALRRSLAGRRPTIEEVARELAMSGRTLQRRLTQAASHFKSWWKIPGGSWRIII